jgi:hypothetical protein
VFKFTAHPATIGVTDGIQVAFAYLQTSWRRWLPAVAVMAACALVAWAAIMTSIGSVDFSSFYYTDPSTNRLIWYTGGQERLWSLVSQYLAIELVTAVLGTIAGWVFSATAICGLRNQPLTVPGVVGRGLLSVVAGIAIAVVSAIAVIGVVVATVIVAMIAPPLGAILLIVELLALIPVALYIAIRLVFVNLAVFDGFGPIEAIRESWRISQRSVLRLLGWGLMGLLLSLGFGIVGSFASAPFSAAGLAAVGQGASTAVTTTGSCLTVFLMAVLYESQRARVDPTLYGPPPIPAPGWGNQWPGYPNAGYPGPYVEGPGPGTGWSAPPTALGAPPAGTYPPAPSWPSDQWAPPSAQGSGIPGWANPNSAGSGWQGGQWAPPAPTYQPPAQGPTSSPGGPASPPDVPGAGEPPARS